MEVKIKIPSNACSLHMDGHKLPFVQLLELGMHFDIEQTKIITSTLWVMLTVSLLYISFSETFNSGSFPLKKKIYANISQPWRCTFPSCAWFCLLPLKGPTKTHFFYPYDNVRLFVYTARKLDFTSYLVILQSF